VRRPALLIVDDSSIMRRLVRKVLALADLPMDRIEEAADGAEALKHLRSAAFDLVLADVNMPVMDGNALLDAMRSDPRLRDIAVVMVGTEGEAHLSASLAARGARYFVRKPFEPVALRQAVLGALSWET
jgi:two-component system chemotaxis response regulator CheY